MKDIRRFFILYDKTPLYQLFFSLTVIIIGGSILFYAILGISCLISGIGWETLISSLESGHQASDVIALRLMLVIQDISLFIIPGSAIMILMQPSFRTGGFIGRIPHSTEIILLIILALCLFPVTSFTGQLNSQMHFPGILSGVEKWMTEKEDQANDALELLISADSLYIVTLNIVIMAILPAIGEEIVFRGVLQKIFGRFLHSGNAAVWFTAFLFSTLHFQFFGFIPRFILGLVFGYLYLWTGTLWIPVISHFINNLFPVLMAGIQSSSKYLLPEDLSLWRQIIVLSFSVMVCFVILDFFRRRRTNKE